MKGDDMTEREMWLMIRRALLMVVAAIERRHGFKITGEK